MTINVKHSQQGQVVHFSKISFLSYEGCYTSLEDELTELSAHSCDTLEILLISQHNVNTSGCVYATLSIRETQDNFTKFLWQHVSNLFSSIQHVFLKWTSSLWVHTPQSVCCNHHLSKSNPALVQEVGQAHAEYHLAGDWALHPWKERTICPAGQSLHWSNAEAEDQCGELRDSWPLLGQISTIGRAVPAIFLPM